MKPEWSVRGLKPGGLAFVQSPMKMGPVGTGGFYTVKTAFL